MSKEITSQLNSYLNKAREELSKLNKKQKPEEVKTSIKIIVEQCISILDFAFNHFSFNKNDYYFPRPENTKVKDYKNKICQYIIHSHNQNNIELNNFLQKCIFLIKKNNWNIRFLRGSIKHSKTADINTKFDSQYFEYEGMGQSPSIFNKTLDIPGFGKFTEGSNIHMSGVVITKSNNESKFNQDYGIIIKIPTTTDTFINQLDYYPNTIGGKLIFFNENNKIIRKYLRSWLKSCIKTCENIIDII